MRPTLAHPLQLSYCRLDNFKFLGFFGPRVSIAMVTSVPMEYRLDGASNFNSWKSRLLINLEESDLMKFVEKVVSKPDDASEKS
jgi:hypothetical protein